MTSPASPRYHLRPAAAADRWSIRRMVWRSQLNPLQLDWRRFWVAVDFTGQIVGCAQIKLHADGSRELASLVVHPHWRGQGVARALIERLLSDGDPPIYLMCADRLVPLYTRFGFRSLTLTEMPPYFARLARVAGSLGRLSPRLNQLRILCWNG